MRVRTLGPALVFAGATALITCFYWAPLWRVPARVDVMALYRYGDEDYFPLVYQLARGRMTEFSVLEADGHQVLPFPLFSVLPYATSVMAFGDWGWPVADALIAVAMFVACAVLVAPLSRDPFWRPALACVVALAAFDQVNLAGRLVHRLAGISLPGFWAPRYPRPFVTAGYELLALLAIMRVGTAAGPRLRDWFLCGVSLGVLVQGDLHAAIGLGILAAIVGGRAAIRSGTPSGAIRIVGAFSAGLLLVTPLFAYQLLNTSAEVKRRWGMFPVPRNRLLVSPDAQWQAAITVVLAIAIGFAFLKLKRGNGHVSRHAASLQPAMWILAASGCAAAALPVSSFVMGSGIQIYHFDDRFWRWIALLIVVLIVWALTVVGREVADRFQWPGSILIRHAGRLALAALAIGAMGVLALRAAVPFIYRQSQMRVFFPDSAGRPGGWPSIKEYRQPFVDLTAFLSASYSTRPLVLGTLDHQVSMWWEGRLGQPLYVPDTFLSTVPDAEIERRAIEFSKFIGLTEQDFLKAVDTRYFNARFFTKAKFQASAAFTYSQLSDYLPWQQQKIEQTTIMSNWIVFIPQSVLRRIARDFERTSSTPSDRLDVIVLNASNRFGDYRVSSDRFEEAYRNREFAVWQRRGLAARAN